MHMLAALGDSAGLKSAYEGGRRNGGGGNRRVEREEMGSGFHQSTLYTYMKSSNNKTFKKKPTMMILYEDTGKRYVLKAQI